jgi:hypothetical protein
MIQDDICFLCIADKSYPRKLAFTYLADLSSEFTTTYQSSQYLSPTLRPYAFVEFDTFIQRTKKLYQDSRASQNLDKLNDELRDVTQVMTKNIEDLLYRGDSLERMGELSGRLREDSKKYRKAAVRINWELLLKQVRLSLRAPFVWTSVANRVAVRAFRRRRFRRAHFAVVAILLSALLLPPSPILNPPSCMNVCIVNTSRWLQDTIHQSLSRMQNYVQTSTRVISHVIVESRMHLFLDLIFLFVKVIFFAHVVENPTSFARAISVLRVKVWQDNTLSIPPLTVRETQFKGRLWLVVVRICIGLHGRIVQDIVVQQSHNLFHMLR